MTRTESNLDLETKLTEAYARRADLLQSLLAINGGDSNLYAAMGKNEGYDGLLCALRGEEAVIEELSRTRDADFLMTTSFDWHLFETLPVIGILRGYGMEEVESIVLYAAKGGLRNIEITMNSDNAAALIRLAQERAEGKMNVGAGTVCSLADLDAALAAGATFIVTPIVNADVIQACNKEEVPVIPGGFTPTEIHQAWQLGADMVKLFPANRFGPGYLKDIRGPFDGIKLIPTGGVDLENLPAYLKNGAYGFGVGSPLFDKERVEAKEWHWVEEQARRFTALYKDYAASN